jgi:regulatory protein
VIIRRHGAGRSEQPERPAPAWDEGRRPARARGERAEPKRGPAAGDPAERDSAASDPAASDPAASDPAERDSAASDPAELAREICLRQLAGRPRTRAELATALRKGGIADEVAAEVLDRYDDVGMIDDEAFARAWVTSRHHGRGLARRALAGELRRKGVGDAAVGEALDELDDATEEATARTLVERRLRVERRDRPEATLRRLVGMLARKGYPPGLAIRVVRDALAADESSAEFADALDPDALADTVADADTVAEPVDRPAGHAATDGRSDDRDVRPPAARS